MDKHTPGPWPMAYSVENKCYAIGDTRPRIAVVTGEVEARLIAAAPELLAALIDLLHQSKLSQDEGGWDFEQAETAIAKATGMTANNQGNRRA